MRIKMTLYLCALAVSSFFAVMDPAFGEDPSPKTEGSTAHDVAALVRTARMYLDQGNLEHAKRALERAHQLAPDDQSISDLLSQVRMMQSGQTAVDLAGIEAALGRNDWTEAERLLKSVTARAPSNPHLADYRARIRQGIEQTLEIHESEKQALLAFYNGDYRAAIATLEQLIARQRNSPRFEFYLGCSKAALALMSPEAEMEKMKQEALQHFGQVKRLDPGFRYDSQDISPLILELFKKVE